MSTAGQQPRPSFRSLATGNTTVIDRVVPDSQSTQQDETALNETCRLILDSAGDGIYGLDTNGFVTFVNPAAREMTGWSLEDLKGRTQHSMVHHSHPDGSPYDRHTCPIYKSLSDGEANRRMDEVFWRKDGTSFPVAYTSTPLLVDGVVRGAVIVFRDITQKIRLQRWEASKHEIFTSIIAGDPLEASMAILTKAFHALHPATTIAVSLQRGDRSCLLAHAGASDDPTLLPDLFANDPAPAYPLSHNTALVWRQIGTQWFFPILSPERKLLGSVALDVPDPEFSPIADPMINGFVQFTRLAFDHAVLQERLLHQLQHDHLTSLPNRALLEDRLSQAIASARRRGTYVGICYIDIDRFKQINDTLGHGVGDEFLQRISKALQSNCRAVDTLARQGGDEFLLVLPNLATAGEAEAIAGRLLEAVRQPFRIADQNFVASASIGISIYPDHGSTATLLMQNADAALYAAKRAGRDQAHTYGAALGDQVRQRASIHADLQLALSGNQFALNYQPLYSTDRHLHGFEALLRWHHPERGVVGPDQFIPVAEETGMIIPIGEWVLREACRQAVDWEKSGYQAGRICVNVSGVQLGREDFAAKVSATLTETGLAPGRLELEITETWIVSDPEAAAAQLQALRDLGIAISIDDFGTGTSSFGCLHQLPLDTLKIDRSFVSRLDGSDKNSSIVRTIVVLARQLGLRTVAEGVENEAQLAELRAANCDFLQGFMLSRPLATAAAADLLRSLTSKAA